jgi:UTP--glucose-1-phosphate uridylyltransferase
MGYLAATVEYGLKHPELGEHFRSHLQSMLNEINGKHERAVNE